MHYSVVGAAALAPLWNRDCVSDTPTFFLLTRPQRYECVLAAIKSIGIIYFNEFNTVRIKSSLTNAFIV